MLLEYDGTRFAGSQLQSNAPTVQSALEDAIAATTGERSRVAFAGRTDAGAHARGQVASFVSHSALKANVLRRALNARLAADVVIRQAVDVEADFDPRRDAVRRHYRYVIDNGETRPALDRGRAWHIGGALDVRSMAEAARLVIGRRDFAAFTAPAEPAGASTVRDLQRFDVSRRGDAIRCDVIANAFLRHQVRRLAGALVEVGRGKLTPDEYAGLLEGPPASAGPTAPAHGLYLMRVEYERELFGQGLDSGQRLC